MKHVRKVYLAAAVLVAVGCDQAPTAARERPGIQGAPTAAPTAQSNHYDIVVASGADADTMVRNTATRWAAKGDRSLQTYVDTSQFWDGTPSVAPRPLPPLRNTQPGPIDLSGELAVVAAASTESSINGTVGMAVTTASYMGTDAHTDMKYGIRHAQQPGGGGGGGEWVGKFDDGHFQQKFACGAQLVARTYPPTACMVWTGTVRGSVRIVLAHDCGESVYSAATTRAWFELPIPGVTINTGPGAGVAFHWAHFGDSAPVTTDEVAASQPQCPEKIVTTPASCGNQIVPDPAGCNPDAATPDIPDAQGGEECQLYLVKYMLSYDHGVTWQVIYSYVDRRC